MTKNINMKNIINKIKNISLEQINKNLIFIAILALLFRVGSFTSNYRPNPFEIIVILIIILAIIDVIKNKKFKEFFLSVPKNIRIALILLVSSIFLGWGISILKGIPTTFNMILEFGLFVFSLSIFLLILFYTRNDKTYLKKYFYALLLPAIYIICIIFPEITNYLNLLSHGVDFVGFTTNENIISKIIIIPTIYFTILTLFEFKNKWLKLVYFLISSSLVALLFWISSRAALLSLIMGCIFILIIFFINNLNWKKIFYKFLIIILIFLSGFLMSPYSAKRVSLNRILNVSSTQSDYSDLKNKPLNNIIKESFVVTKISENLVENKKNIVQNKPIIENRFQFWPIYLKQILINPLGFGPNTHIEFYSNDNINKINLGPHNSYLQIWLWGGIIGLLSFLYLLFLAFINLKNRLKSNFNSFDFSLVSILFTLSILILANDSISLYWFWIILALSLVYDSNTKS